MEEAKENNPFILPAGYFESLDKNIEAGLAIGKPEIMKETGFDVPEGYFDSLHGDILQRTIEAENKKVRVISIFRNRTFWAAAASVAILITIGISILNRETVKPVAGTFLSDKTKRSIMENPGVYSIDESLLIETIEGQICSDCPEAGPDEVTNYLLENNVDVQSLVEENK